MRAGPLKWLSVTVRGLGADDAGISRVPLKEQYEAAVREIARDRVAPNGSFEIPRDATKRACIAYTLYHVCGQRPGMGPNLSVTTDTTGIGTRWTAPW